MSQTHSKLEAQRREIFGRKVKHLRADGFIPANVFGFGNDSIAIQIPTTVFEQLLTGVTETDIIDVTIDNGDAVHPVLLANVQRDPVTRDIIHVDLREVDLTKVVTAEVEVVLEGESSIVKAGQGVLLDLLNAIEVTALPDNLPSEVIVNISKLQEIGDSINVSDIDLGEKVIIETDPELMICKIDAVRVRTATEDEDGVEVSGDDEEGGSKEEDEPSETETAATE